ncbi:RNA polymerase subunit sigma-70 [Mycobacterium kansasii]|nr:RNA polymerase subunit sigma-70 [Mycobacterium kansasii]
MRCDVAREELSARLDGERPQMLAQQVDAHLESCRRCRAWLIGAAAQSRRFAAVDARRGPDLAERILASAGVAPAPRFRRWLHIVGPRHWQWCLIGVGVFQIALAAAQISGIDFGIMPRHQPGAMMHGQHLLHESTAWLLALGLAMIVAAVWSSAALGVAAIAGTYSLALLGYVAVDAWRGEVTAARIASHVPVLAGTVFALLVARDRTGAAASQPTETEPAPTVRPAALAHGRRHGHLRPVNRFTTSTTAGRMHGERCRLRWMPMTAATDDEAVTELALAAATGNARALEAFIKATQQDVWRFVTYLSDAGSADDLTQETFLRAIGSIHRFSGRSSARTWLLSIARRVVADHIRYLRSRPRSAPGADPERLLDGHVHARGFEELVEVTTMIAQLTADQREALLLTQLLGLSYADAAAVCGCPVGTIRSRVARARDALLADTERDELTG